jgi:hypothetical protein
MFDNTYLSELGHYSRLIVIEALDNIYSFSEIRGYLLNIFFLYIEEKVLLVYYVLYSIFKTACYNFEISLLFSSLKESLICSIIFL